MFIANLHVVCLTRVPTLCQPNPSKLPSLESRTCQRFVPLTVIGFHLLNWGSSVFRQAHYRSSTLVI